MRGCIVRNIPDPIEYAASCELLRHWRRDGIVKVRGGGAAVGGVPSGSSGGSTYLIKKYYLRAGKDCQWRSFYRVVTKTRDYQCPIVPHG